MRELLNFIRPPEDADWKAINRWRWNVCLTLLVLCAGAIFAVSPAGFAYAGDLDKKIKDAIEPIAQQQKVQGEKLDQVSRLLTEQLAATVAAQIRLAVSKRCKTAGFVEREELARELDRLQDQYVTYKGSRYTAPTCGEL